MQDSVYGITSNGELKISIIQSLAYSSVFNYPLKVDEIINGMGQKTRDESTVQNELNELLEEGIVSKRDDLYGLKAGDEDFRLRESRNARAEKYMPLARFISRFISQITYIIPARDHFSCDCDQA